MADPTLTNDAIARPRPAQRLRPASAQPDRPARYESSGIPASAPATAPAGLAGISSGGVAPSQQNYGLETARSVVFPDEVSTPLRPSAARAIRSTFTRATRFPSISAIVKRKSPKTKLSPPFGMNPS